MAELGPKKGTVTALGSLFPAEEAQKASKRVHDAIADRRGELDRLKAFVADNSALTKLVRQLPDEISHEIMVPFGSAAFFPGRLIHTNEFLVLLGDGYYAERTSKQTVDILKRREKSLECQVEALKASLLDLEAEAKFFASTAVEAKEGIVEIREEYTEEPSYQQEDIIEIREEYIEEPQKESESDGSIKNDMVSSHVAHKPPLHPDPKEDLHNFSGMKLEDFSNNISSKSGKIGYSERKAFTGSVIEHTHGLQSDQPAKSTSSNQPMKPVSRFKMMKGNH